MSNRIQDRMVDFAIIGKAKLIEMIGTQTNYKTTDVEYITDTERCKQMLCPIFLSSSSDNDIPSATQSLVDDHCSSCECVTRKTKTIYHNERHRYGIDKVDAFKRHRLSELALKQLLVYHSLGPDAKGIVRNISETELADLLGCTVKTIRNNNCALSEYGYIYHSLANKGQFNIIVKGFVDDAFKQGNRGGGGYLYISNEEMLALLDLKGVNTIRLALRAKKKDDDANYEKSAQDTFDYTDLTWLEMRRSLPSHINSKEKMQAILQQLKTLYDVKEESGGAKIRLHDKYNIAKLKEKKMPLYENVLTATLMAYDYPAQSTNVRKDIDDLLQMSDQYGIQVVQVVTEKILRQYKKSNCKIRQLGGLVRSMITGKTKQVDQKSYKDGGVGAA